ncbi:trace amine-associated receptor 1-like [Hypomesus transpacificus]|uniref:trace amine-associated receptor 1-like n=1 Tax=Hypomesus transpacificus TaxID=137520 RepID=UPI001F0786E6|nr:trace amine-associated receptor 1-like [Hypomesus transpacificus]
MEPGHGINSSHMVDSIHLCYEHVNKSCVMTYVLSPAVKGVVYIIFGTIILLTVAGNMLVIISILHFKQLHTPTNFLILSLAVADLLLGVLVLPPSMVVTVENCWYMGDIFYRYYAVCRPLRYTRTITVQSTMVMVLVSWGVSALVGFGTIFLQLNILGEEEFYYEHVVCEGGCGVAYQTATSSAVSSSLSFYLPALIMLCIYLKIFLVAQRQARSIQSTTFQNQNSGAVASKSERKAFKTLAIVMGVFLCCWTPFFLCNISAPYIEDSNIPLLMIVTSSIGFSNSFLNAIVYAFFYSWFRRAFRTIVVGSIFQPQSSNTKLVSD